MQLPGKVSWLNDWRPFESWRQHHRSNLCDESAKVDMAPLQTSEVNDDLAQMAFAVQEIRGHS